VQSLKEDLVKKTLEDLSTIYISGAYNQIEKDVELFKRFTDCESKINSLVNSGNVVDLKIALKEYWHIHFQACNKIMDKVGVS